jgi:hypothetical protein
VLTEEIFYSKFDRPRTYLKSASIENTPPLSDTIKELSPICQSTPTNLRKTYTSFLFLQVFLLLTAPVFGPILRFQGRLPYPNDPNDPYPLSSFTSLPTITVALILFQSRNIALDNGRAKKLALIFVAHCIVATMSMIRHEVSNISFVGRRDELRRILTICCIMWNCLCSFIATATLCRSR